MGDSKDIVAKTLPGQKSSAEIFTEAALELADLKEAEKHKRIETAEDLGQFLERQNTIRVFESLLQLAREIESERTVYKSILDKFKKAIDRYHNSCGESTNEKARKFLREIGLIKHKRQKRFDKATLLQEYQALLRGVSETEATLFNIEARPAMSKWKAVDHLTQKHGIASRNACYQHLKIAQHEYNEKHPQHPLKILPAQDPTR